MYKFLIIVAFLIVGCTIQTQTRHTTVCIAGFEYCTHPDGEKRAAYNSHPSYFEYKQMYLQYENGIPKRCSDTTLTAPNTNTQNQSNVNNITIDLGKESK